MTVDARLLLATAWRMSPRRVLLQVVLLVANGLVGGASLLLLIPIVQSIADAGASLDLPAVGSVALGGIPLGVLLGMFVALVAAQAVIAYATATTTMRTQQQLVDRLREEAFAAVLAARWTFLLRRRRSDVIAIVSVGASRAGLAYSQMLQVAVAAILAVATAVVALLVSPAIALIAIAGVAVLGLALSVSVRPAHRLGVELGGRHRELQSVITDSLDSLRLVRAHSASVVWTGRLAEAFTGAREVQVANVRRQSLVSGLTVVGTAVAASLLVLVAVGLDVPTADLVVVLLLVVRLAQHVRQMVTAAATMANALPAVRDLGGLTRDASAEVEIAAGSASTRPPLGTDAGVPLLEFRDVSYTYPDSEGGVRGLDLDVPRGAVTVLTGRSGAGKSTAVDLALGLLLPDGGQVLVDGTPLAAGDLEWWRRHIAYVPQETLLLPGTLRDNLVWSVPGGCTDEQCWQALDQAAAAFARALPAGLDTLLGDRGVRLSGGERQRVALARALLRRPALLVLDEATSALDEETEQQVLALLATLTPQVTVLVIAHRRSTMQAADHVVHLGD
ncbi:MAG: ABC transporter ATP-binding protein [Candidatus Nanopelagicales bacterium]